MADSDKEGFKDPIGQPLNNYRRAAKLLSGRCILYGEQTMVLKGSDDEANLQKRNTNGYNRNNIQPVGVTKDVVTWTKITLIMNHWDKLRFS